MTKNRRLLLPLLLLLPLGGISLAYFFFTPSPADAFLNAPTPAAATQENLWARVEIAKPTHTPVSLPTETPTQIPIATETPAVLAIEIVNEISVALEQAKQIEADPPPAPVISGGSKYILVDISDQHMYVYENDALIYSFVASTGINNATRVGVFAVQSKFDNAYGATWDIWMPNWLGIYWAGGLENGIHALPILPSGATLWEGFLGRPVSYGCVVLGTYESKLLYDWAEMGSTVEIQW
ncbi:MAG TPA: L,D-transpeptidase [Anaerolineales bacterium]|jgi:lipoprotein-anchoring transpeptidase ErfK/SrfK|nr:L,D-transpeptidase [Anaerolineales bacterium]HQX16047.1 L,D-transpeptidase [Anaerolineales bacterium]